MATLSARTLSLLAQLGPCRTIVLCAHLQCHKDLLKSTLARLYDSQRVVKHKGEVGVMWSLPVKETPAGRIEAVTYQWVVKRR